MGTQGALDAVGAYAAEVLAYALAVLGHPSGLLILLAALLIPGLLRPGTRPSADRDLTIMAALFGVAIAANTLLDLRLAGIPTFGPPPSESGFPPLPLPSWLAAPEG